MIAHFIQVAIPVVLIVIFSIITTLFMGIKLTQSEFGDFALLKTFILIGSTFSILGIDNYYIRYVQCIKCYKNNIFDSYLLLGLTIVMVMMVFGDMFMANSYKRSLWVPAILFVVYSKQLSNNKINTNEAI